MREVVRLRDKGHSLRDIGAYLGVAPNTVRADLLRWDEVCSLAVQKMTESVQFCTREPEAPR
jgi:hypothetical protein